MQKSILITGCLSGIGYDGAHGLKARGWRVFASLASRAKRFNSLGFDDKGSFPQSGHCLH